uniref:Uncharacterized protein n=1 Tax=Sphaerodactylus townsendi TaxID=933632 RepID=A0ACB8FD31_9SAUR
MRTSREGRVARRPSRWAEPQCEAPSHWEDRPAQQVPRRHGLEAAARKRRSLRRPRGEAVDRPSPVAASPPSQDWRAWKQMQASRWRSHAGASSARRRPPGGLSRPGGLPPPEALGRPIQQLGMASVEAWRRRRPLGGRSVASGGGVEEQLPLLLHQLARFTC